MLKPSQNNCITFGNLFLLRIWYSAQQVVNINTTNSTNRDITVIKQTELDFVYIHRLFFSHWLTSCLFTAH